VTKQGGLGDNLYVAGYDLSGDIGSLSKINGGPAALEVTGINKSAPERLGGERDGGMDFTAFFNKAAGQAHLRLGSLPTTDTIVTYCRGTTLGNSSAVMVGKQVNYDPSHGQDGSLTFGVSVQSTLYGLEWGRQLTAGKRSDTTATNGTSVDMLTGSTAFGLQAYLHVFSFTGTSCTVTIQESSDNGGGDAFAAVTGGAFTAATGVTSQRIATAAGQTVERYLRVVTTGTFSECTFAVTVIRNDTAVVF